MNISEILDKAKEISDYGEDGKQHTRMFNQFEAKALLDYITNLQKEVRINNDLIPYFKNRVKSLKKSITNLQEENERLLKQLENSSLDEANIRADILLEQQDYKTRNEKAIEYIENHSEFEPPYYEYREFYNKGNLTDLLNILQGSDE